VVVCFEVSTHRIWKTWACPLPISSSGYGAQSHPIINIINSFARVEKGLNPRIDLGVIGTGEGKPVVFCCQSCDNGWLSGQPALHGSLDNCSPRIGWLEDLGIQVLFLDLGFEVMAGAEATDQEYALRTGTRQRPRKVL